eukprot:1075017-Prorocentrum_minimum.AAC.1
MKVGLAPAIARGSPKGADAKSAGRAKGVVYGQVKTPKVLTSNATTHRKSGRTARKGGHSAVIRRTITGHRRVRYSRVPAARLGSAGSLRRSGSQDR